MKKLLVVLITTISFLQVACSSEETASEGIKQIASLYAEKNFEKLVRERYAEIHKAESEADVTKIIEHFEGRFSDERRLKQVLDIYEQARKISPEIVENPSPQITETSKMAVFKLENAEIKLYLLKTGKWGFHQ